ncbi:MAG TPA: prephenate dehydratase [Candidatus Omnitrophota bacterium]|nr:prephenate dehydratase [Candidatus Omnitrophota bacterium]
MKVGYLGPEGTFSEDAGKLYSRRMGKNVKLIPFPTFHDVIMAAQKGEVDESLVPVENSIEGTIPTVTDMLAREVTLKIRQELVIPVYNYLLAQKGVKIGEITDVISHPQPIEQCKEFLRRRLPKAKLHLSYSTSDAARQVAMSLGEKVISHGKIKGPVFAAIGPLSMAKLYGLSVIANKINAKDNQTRFVVLARADHKRTGDDKTSIVFSIAKDRPGGLHSVLFEFARRDVNLTKIESRPSKRALGEYFFFVDMQGHRDDTVIKDALANVKKRSAFFKLLGSYPRFK